MLHCSRILLLAFSLVFISTAASGRGDVAEAPEQICPILVGSSLPAITVKSLDGAPFDLNKAVAAKPTVLIYFRGGW